VLALALGGFQRARARIRRAPGLRMHFLAGGAFGLLCAVFCAFVIPQWITPADDSPTLLVSEARWACIRGK